MIQCLLATVQSPETLQQVIRSWFDFAWELLQHPLISFLFGFIGGAHIDGGVRRLYGKTRTAVKAAVHLKKPEEKELP